MCVCVSKLQTLIEFYGREQRVTFEGETNVFTPDVEEDNAKAVCVCVCVCNIVSLASLAITLPLTTATVERSFSDMKLIKTRLRNKLGEESLDQAMRICIEGPDTLSDADLVEIITHWKEQKPRRIFI